MHIRFLPAVFLLTLLISACADPEQTALEEYLSRTDTLGDQMVEMGTKFETLMNIQEDVLAWSDAEEAELDAVHNALLQLKTDAETLTPPAILANVHPLLVGSIEEMRMAVEGVMRIVQNPTLASNRLATEIETHGTNGEELATRYVEEMESAIGEAYPEMMEE